MCIRDRHTTGADNASAHTETAALDQQDIQNITAAMANYEAEALNKCQADLAQLQAKSAELADQFLRAKADAENARRRAEDDVSKARKFAIEGFADSLLPVIDSLEAVSYTHLDVYKRQDGGLAAHGAMGATARANDAHRVRGD